MSETPQIPRIKSLSSALANQIAAGEVIERPASVVKELLENCLDAGATRIAVDISKAGGQLIRVTDNGHGIHPDDLILALQRHATAKLSHQSDLTAIHSLGFRGEALPSIASVANFTITSRIAAREQATRLVIDAQTGQSELVPTAHPVGTTVEVSNLFHNTPARKKFLSSERTEFLHIQETVRRLALSRFNFSLELGHNGKRVFSCRAPGEDREVRVASVLGQAFTKKAIALEHNVADMQLRGWLGAGDLCRSTSDRQYLYLNGRMIRDKRLNHAIRVACEDLVAIGRYPSYVLYLEMDAGDADVNVHPTKHEVRFRHARDVHDFLYAAICASLQNAQSLLTDSSDSGPVALANEESDYPRRHNTVGELRTVYSDFKGKHQTGLASSVTTWGQVLLQINQDYLLSQRDTDLLLINIPEAKKYIAQVKFDASCPGESISGRPLLVPVSYEISKNQEAKLASIALLLEDCHMQLELSGPGICRVRAIPHLLEYADITSLVSDLLDVKISSRSNIDIRQDLIATMVGHVDDIPNKNMSAADMTALLRQLQGSGVDGSLRRYPPIWTTLTPRDLQRFISRDE